MMLFVILSLMIAFGGGCNSSGTNPGTVYFLILARNSVPLK